MTQPFMILSHHRSGSNFLCNLLQCHPNVECLNEPFSMHTDLFRKIDLEEWNAVDYDEEYLHIYLKEFIDCSDFFKKMRDFLLEPDNFCVRGVKDTILFEKMHWLKKYLPALKIIYIVRDPRAVVYSIIKRSMWDIWDYKNKIPEFIKKNYKGIKIDKDDPVQLCMWSWKIRREFCINNLYLFDNIVLRLEDIILEPEIYLKKLMNFIEKDVDKKQWDFFEKSHIQSRGVAYSTNRRIEDVLNTWKDGLGDYDKRYIEANLREEMVQLGYI